MKFDDYYRNIWGERWPGLREALCHQLINGTHNKRSILQFHSSLPEYELDSASLCAVDALQVEDGVRILDMCAAPGGKSLGILKKLMSVLPDGSFKLSQSGELAGELVANERSTDRRFRLINNLKTFTGQSDLETLSVRVTGYDASRIGLYQKESYDRILADVPCSSEGHVLQSEKHLNDWSLSRPKRLAIEQYAILASGWMALKPGGILVYSTCSINPQENDGVIQKLLKKQEGVEIQEFKGDLLGQATTYGTWYLPDQCLAGPMYVAVLKKGV